MLYEFNIMSTSLPDIKDPNMTPEYMSEGPSLCFGVPSCPENRRLKGLNLTFKYTLLDGDWAWFAKISTANGVDLMYNPKVFGKPAFSEFAIWLSYWPIGNILEVGDKVNVSIVVMSGLEVCECGASLVYTDDEVAKESLESMEWVEILGGDLSEFQLSTGAYYLCRHDFFELMEVGRLSPDWFTILVGDTIDYTTEVRGWRKTGRPKQSYQSFTQLKTVRCIIHDPESEEIYKITKMSKTSYVDKNVEFTSSILLEKKKSATASELSDATEKSLDLYLDLYPDEAFEVDGGSEKESATATVTIEPEKVVDMSKASQVNEAMELLIGSLEEKLKSATNKFSKMIIEDPLHKAPLSTSHRHYDVYLSFSMFDVGYFGVHLNDALVRVGFWICGGGYMRTAQVRASIVVLSESYISSSWDLDMLLLVLEQRRNSNHYVLPVFYGLRSSDLRVHGKDFLLRIFRGSTESMGKVDRWHAALEEVSVLPGIDMFWNNDEPTIIEGIVGIMQRELYYYNLR